MDLKALKLELLERIALLDDEARLLALKRLLDAPRGYGIPNEKMNVVKEGPAFAEASAGERGEAYLRIEDRSYTAAEVQALLNGIRSSMLEERSDFASHFSKEEWDAMDREREQAERGEGTFYTMEEVLQQMKKDLGE